jgi:hypothetical protein
MPTARTLGSGHSIADLAGSSTGHNFRLTHVRCTGWLSSLPPTPLRRGCLHDSCQLPPAFVRKGVAEQWIIEEPPGERDGIALFQPVIARVHRARPRRLAALVAVQDEVGTEVHVASQWSWSAQAGPQSGRSPSSTATRAASSILSHFGNRVRSGMARRAARRASISACCVRGGMSAAAGSWGSTGRPVSRVASMGGADGAPGSGTCGTGPATFLEPAQSCPSMGTMICSTAASTAAPVSPSASTLPGEQSEVIAHIAECLVIAPLPGTDGVVLDVCRLRGQLGRGSAGDSCPTTVGLARLLRQYRLLLARRLVLASSTSGTVVHGPGTETRTKTINSLVVIALFSSQSELESGSWGVKLSMDLSGARGRPRDG